MANQWLRLWHEMPNDPKWRTIARTSGEPIGLVISVYVHLLVDASRNVTRGHATVTQEDLASALDVTDSAITSVLSAMQGRVLDGMRLLGWETRQPKREDAGDGESGPKTAAQRKAEQRERERAAINKSDVTQCHDESRNVTTDKDKEEDKENKEKPMSSGDDARPCPAEALVDLYHECMPMNPQVRVLNDARRKMIRQRWREAAKLDCAPFGYATRDDGMAAWRAFFLTCAESDFLTGRVAAQPGKPPFVADIDFLFSPSGFARTLENKYHREAV